MKKSAKENNSLCKNRKALHDYFIEQRLEAGICLQGWEVKALRKARGQLKESYIKALNGEIWLIGCHISQLESTSTHYKADPTRTRKLLLHKKEINTLIGKIEQKGYTLVPLSLYLKNGKIKIEVGVARGKKQHDKRKDIKERDTKLQLDRAMKKHN